MSESEALAWFREGAEWMRQRAKAVHPKPQDLNLIRIPDELPQGFEPLGVDEQGRLVVMSKP